MQCCPLTCFVSCDELCECQQMQSLNDTVSLGKENGEFQNGSGYIKLKGCILKISPKHQCAWFPNQLSDLAEISSPPDLKPSKAFCSYFFFYVITYIFYLLTTLSNYLLCVFICSCFPCLPEDIKCSEGTEFAYVVDLLLFLIHSKEKCPANMC